MLIETASNSTASVSSHAFANSTKAASLCNQWLYERLYMSRVLWKYKISGLENDVIPSVPDEHTELASSLEAFETMATSRAPVGLPPSPLRVSGSDHGDSCTGLYGEFCTGRRTGKHRGYSAGSTPYQGSRQEACKEAHQRQQAAMASSKENI
ncbi:hypothetical protein GcM3_027017 [Golovinomyces cichoracearum]|uniref:Uncharacterized protein n=1 Tax=Golovinomyces cichoracearum TaxID=62708 RepID=A0A420J5W2_9PEZI|nr:hypothetical protein GcM3_027017 [Golovinomyces cichoracearum]